MYINPRTAIEQGWIKLPAFAQADPEKYIQPNAIDITVDQAFRMKIDGRVWITEDEKRMPEWVRMEPNATGEIVFLPSNIYDVMSDFYVEVPEGVCANLIIRSSFSRCGIRLSSGLYDSGFKGNIGFSIHNLGQPLATKFNTRIAQIAFVASDSAKQYAGGWNAEEGKHWSDLGRTS